MISSATFNGNPDTLVVDVGSFSSRFGYSGDDNPRCFRSLIAFGGEEASAGSKGRSSSSSVKGTNSAAAASSSSSSSGGRRGDLVCGDDVLSSDPTGMGISYPVKDGTIEDWDMYTDLWHHGYESLGLESGHDSSVIMTEKSHSSSSNREKMGEVFFESLKIPSLFIARDAALSMYACGRTTGLVIDCGSSCTSISPVIDGWVESRGLSRSIVGGSYMDAYAMSLLSEAHQPKKGGKIATLTPQLLLNMGSNTQGAKSSSSSSSSRQRSVDPSYEAFANLEMAREFKESFMQVSENPLAKVHEETESESYQLPDGNTVEFGIEKFQCAELLFDPSKYEFDYSANLDPLGFKYTQVSSLVGVPKLASDAVLRCEVDLQLQLLANVVVVGGVSTLQGMPERLQRDIEAVLKKNYPLVQVRQISPEPEHRSIAAWLGGSILGSMGGTINELSVTKKEYDEYGANIMDKKFP